MIGEKAVLIINAGSSSIKFSVFEMDGLALVYTGLIDNVLKSPQLTIKDTSTVLVQQALQEKGHQETLNVLLDWLDMHLTHRVAAVGHRVVHGGTIFSTPVVITPDVVASLEGIIPLAPLHEPHNLAAIYAVTKRSPHLPQIACFDTAFHTTQPTLARAYALPRKYTEAGIIRYGFHGLSYEYITSVLPSYLGDKAKGRVIIAHLGNGVSMCAVKDGKSVATTMGFTALEGLVMGTRAGSIDPGILLYFLEQKGFTPAELNQLLYKESGLLGVSGISHDMRELEQSNKPEAKEAIALFCYRIMREIGSLCAALGGLDALVFTAGIGEKSALVRQTVSGSLSWLGVEVDAVRNMQHLDSIHSPQSAVKVLVIPTNEELMIAKYTLKSL